MSASERGNGATGVARKVVVWGTATIVVATIVGGAWSWLMAQALRPIVADLSRGIARDSMIVVRLQAMEVAREKDARALAEILRYPVGSSASERAVKRVRNN